MAQPSYGFSYLVPAYGFDANIQHIAVPAGGEKALLQMAQDIAGTPRLAVIYVPEGTEDVYQPGVSRGRVVGAVQLLPMPPGKSTGDYFYDDWDGKRRWPLGWPCRAACAPPVEQCPVLRSLVELHHGPGRFQPYVGRLQHGPVKLDSKVARELEKRFAAFKPVS